MIKIIASVVFVAYGIMAGFAVHDLFGPWTVLVAVAVAAALLWEIWVQPARDEKYRQQLLTDIQGMKFDDIPKVGNVSDARDIIGDLQEQLHVVSSAYIELKEQEDDDDEEECDHVGGLVLTDCGDYCSRCGEIFSDFTGSNLMGG